MSSVLKRHFTDGILPVDLKNCNHPFMVGCYCVLGLLVLDVVH